MCLVSLSSLVSDRGLGFYSDSIVPKFIEVTFFPLLILASMRRRLDNSLLIAEEKRSLGKLPLVGLMRCPG
ncbi:hypothetical protein L1987_39520 [Smallanthus sonchifolius]|uniref:Uncharacterized protein n=1 Tax=Smallanthus sonchifolius TaxID=185202 RepID=A0ACB9HM80_9ASTR|nr:hypothetical protein L1987_39520 [Smallanthus sonchifolius]